MLEYRKQITKYKNALSQIYFLLQVHDTTVSCSIIVTSVKINKEPLLLSILQLCFPMLYDLRMHL